MALLRDADDQPVGFRSVHGRLGIVDLDTPVALFEGSLVGMRIYAGYAGWDPEQLQGEIARGDWYVAAGEAGGRLRRRRVRAVARRHAAPARPAGVALHTPGRPRPELTSS